MSTEPSRTTESVVEDAALDWLDRLGYDILSGLVIAPGEPAAERADYKQVFLFDRCQTKLEYLNPKIPLEGLQEALRKIRLISHPTLIENNRAFRRLLVEGVDVEFRSRDGQIVRDKVWSLTASPNTCAMRCPRRRSSASPARRLKVATRTRRPVFGDLASKPAPVGFPSLPFALSRAVVIDVYDILQSKEDKATVPIYYEARLAKIDLKPEERPKIDPNFEEVTEDAEESTKESLRRKWAQLEAMVGTDKRIALVAEDLVKHWEARYAAMEGKAMVVCMSRRICVELYKALQKLRPEWHHDHDDKGTMKIVMSGSASDTLDWQKHIRSKKRREELAKAFKNPKKPFRIVIVRDMWLTGFDAPSCTRCMWTSQCGVTASCRPLRA